MRLLEQKPRIVTVLLVVAVLGPLAAQLTAQTADLPRRTEPYSWTSGSFDGFGTATDPPGLVREDVVAVPGVPWMQLRFDHVQLGRRSFLEITSLADGATQVLDAKTLKQWNQHSAYFNGDALEVRLFVGSLDRAVSINIPEIVVGELGPSPDKSICGSDNRVASNEPRVGRIDPIGCTGWIINSGQLLTAGHCLDGGSSNQVLSFNVPPSLSNGAVQFPGPEDQYSINQSSFNFVDGGVGNDWGVFAVFDNSQTGLQPIQAQGSFTVRQDLGPANLRITGFGVDSGTTNQTNQTHVGPNAGSSGTTMRYVTDTQGGNSGSPVIDEATGEAVGIHSHGGCTSSGGNNNGTSFFRTALWNAIDTAPPPPPTCPAGSLDFSSLALVSYSNQNVSNQTQVLDGGDTLNMTGNTWKRTTQTFNITANTVVEFLYASTDQGEIHAIGFDADDTLNDEPAHFQIWGTQNWTGTGNVGRTAQQYSGSGSFESFTIPVGQTYTGTRFLVFTNDNDSGTGNGNFSCVRVFEDTGGGGNCTVDDDFESGSATGWFNDGASTCSTGAYVLNDPTVQSSGGVTTQVGGSNSGVFSIFTATNTSAGNADVDGGNCILGSPTWSVGASSTLSVAYWHGQRDNGDDPGDDFFLLEYSTNGGSSWNTLASNGDSTSNASWSTATAQIPGGANVALRVQCSDGAGPGDIVECGIDDVSICDN